MKYAYADIKENKFNKILHPLTKYLRQQQKLISDIQSTCPKATTRWMAMGATCQWLLEKRNQVLYIILDNKIEAPAGWWWIVASAINTLSKEVNVVFIKLQSKRLLVSQQAAEFNGEVDTWFMRAYYY